VTVVVFLTFFLLLLSVPALMRRSLRIRAAYEPTRMSVEQLEFAYEVVVSSMQYEDVQVIAERRECAARSSAARRYSRAAST